MLQKSMSKFLPISFMICASFCFACASILIKAVGANFFGEGVHALQITHARFFFAAMILCLIWYIFRPEVKPTLFKLHLLRSICGWGGVAIFFTAILFIPVSDATALTFLNPIFAMFFAFVIFKEQISGIRWAAALFSFVGGLLLIRPTIHLQVDPIALLCLFGALVMGLEIVCIKALSSRDSIFTILLVNNLLATFVGTIVLPFFFKVPSWNELCALISVGLLMLSGQFCFINAIKRGETGFLMPFFYITLIFVILIDFLVFQSIPDRISFAGGFIIIFGAAYLAIKEPSVRSNVIGQCK